MYYKVSSYDVKVIEDACNIADMDCEIIYGEFVKPDFLMELICKLLEVSENSLEIIKELEEELKEIKK